VVDNTMQYTEKDQPFYEEFLAHLSLNSHPSAKKVRNAILCHLKKSYNFRKLQRPNAHNCFQSLGSDYWWIEWGDCT
jgi:hypothetical protein